MGYNDEFVIDNLFCLIDIVKGDVFVILGLGSCFFEGYFVVIVESVINDIKS